MRFHPIDILHGEPVVMIHILFFLASFNGFACCIFQFYPFRVGGSKYGYELPSSLKCHLNLASHRFFKLSENLERLVKAG